MTQLDFTKPLALESDPFTLFPGPFIGPDRDGEIAAMVDGWIQWWDTTGKAKGSTKDYGQLVSLKVKVKEPKWLKGVAEYFPHEDDVWGQSGPRRRLLTGTGGRRLRPSR